MYNRIGFTIVSVTVGTTTSDPPTASGAPTIPAYSNQVIALLVPPSTWNQSDTLVAVMPSDMEVGDVVEVYTTPGTFTGVHPSVLLLPASGETLNSGENPYYSVGIDSGKICRKVTTTNWQLVGQLG